MLHDKMKKILAGKRSLSDNEHKAKLDVVKSLRDQMAGEMGGKLDGLKKVSVMADSPEGLQHGLEKAKEIASNSDFQGMKDDAESGHSELPDEDHLSDGGDVQSDDESPEEEASESPDEESHEEFHGLDMHEIDEKLQKLLELKKKMESK